jgi:hypothetical protein
VPRSDLEGVTTSEQDYILAIHTRRSACPGKRSSGVLLLALRFGLRNSRLLLSHNACHPQLLDRRIIVPGRSQDLVTVLSKCRRAPRLDLVGSLDP